MIDIIFHSFFPMPKFTQNSDLIGNIQKYVATWGKISPLNTALNEAVNAAQLIVREEDKPKLSAIIAR